MKTDITITAAAIATLISALTATLVNFWMSKNNKKKGLDDQLDGILKIAIQYPFLESEHFTSSWTPKFDRNEEKYLRYDIYCTLLFNFLCRVAEHFKYDKKRIENYIGIKDWVRLHAEYWNHPTSSYENIDTYDNRFVDLVNSYLK